MSNVSQAQSARYFRTITNECIVEHLDNECLLISKASTWCDSEALDRALYSNSAKNFKRPNTREDSSDLDEKNTEFIAAMGSTSGKKCSTLLRLKKKLFQNSVQKKVQNFKVLNFGN